jgi:peptide/nickel transport system permease protein
MPALLSFILRRLLAIPVTLLIVTAVLYGFVMLTPPEVRVSIYLPSNLNPDRLTPEQLRLVQEQYIERYHLNDPFPIQYAYWLASLMQDEWGWSPTLHETVLPALLRRTPVTAELTLYSILLFIPLGILNGLLAGWKKDSLSDHGFRLAAFIATSLPVFVLALVLLSVFYVGLRWFPPERLSIQSSLLVRSAEFQWYTGLLTVDGLLNGRPDISLEALRHLVLPVTTLSLLHWATLGRVTRAAVIAERRKQYAIAATARGISERRLMWRHILRNILSPALTSSALSSASLITGVFIVEVIYNFKGISDLVMSVSFVPDANPILGFAIYSVIIVLVLMFVLDVTQALIDPRVREGLLE